MSHHLTDSARASTTSAVTRSLAAIGLGLLCHVAFTGCSAQSSMSTVHWQADGMPHHTHPTQDWWRYQFVYHPRAQVYYQPYTRTWFWFDDGQWYEGSEKPAGIHIDSTLARVVHLDSEKPHEQHETVLSQAGPWRGGHPPSVESGPSGEHRAGVRPSD